MKRAQSNRQGAPARPLQKSVSSALVLSLAAIISIAAAPARSLAGPAGYSFQAIASLGSPAPNGAFVSDFEPTRLNNRGQIAFTAEPDVPGEEAVFLSGGGTIQQIMRFGEPAPGGGTFSTFELGPLGLNDSGDVALAFMLDPLQFDPFINGGVYRYSHSTGSLTNVVTPGMTVPGVGVLLGAGFAVSLNNQGALAFDAFTDTADGPKQGTFVAAKDNTIATVAMHGTSAPGGGSFDSTRDPWVNDRGDVAFAGNKNGDVLTEAIYVKRAATGRIEALPQPPGFFGAYAPIINNRGDVVFDLQGHPLADGIGAIYLKTGNSLVRVAGTGDPTPVGNISIIAQVIFVANLALNNAGDIAFDVATDTGDEALLLYSQGNLTVVAHIGTVIPGVGTIHSLEQAGTLICCPPPPVTGFPGSFAALNDLGQVAFVATLEDGKEVLLLATPLP